MKNGAFFNKNARILRRNERSLNQNGREMRAFRKLTDVKIGNIGKHRLGGLELLEEDSRRQSAGRSPKSEELLTEDSARTLRGLCEDLGPKDACGG